ncbi:MAG: YicC family protein [Rhodospirillales bacterium]|nr:YicC family protein [Rhodospirillales bacterium]
MTIASMTGFARLEGSTPTCAWTWEVRSVNARGLDIRSRLPAGFEALEPAVRQRVGAGLKRCNVSLTLQLAWTGGDQAVRINTQVLDAVLALVPQVESRLADHRPSSAEGLLALRGVIEVSDPVPTGAERATLEATLLAGLDQVLATLIDVRRAEGRRLSTVLCEHFVRLSVLAERASVLASLHPAAIAARLKEQLASLLGQSPALPEERLAQEIALLATKADSREELDRLRAHHEAAVALLERGGAVGRQLDFLCQEFNREANTLCAKSGDIELTRVGLDLKATIEQIREQVQNIE